MTEQASQNPGSLDNFWKRFPWWFVAAIGLLVILLYIILTKPSYREAFQFIANGLSLALIITITSFVPAILIGALIGLGCRSKNTLIRNLALFYLAIVGGIPTIIMIFVISFVVIPYLFGLIGIESRVVPTYARVIIALALAYSAIYGDVFRLGLSKIPQNPLEKPTRSSRSVLLIAVGVAFIALLKDSSLAIVLAVREITQMSRLYAGSTFQFREAYVTAIFFYLVLTISLRFLLQQSEQRLSLNRQ